MVGREGDDVSSYVVNTILEFYWLISPFIAAVVTSPFPVFFSVSCFCYFTFLIIFNIVFTCFRY